jgi:hypothetical protein
MIISLAYENFNARTPWEGFLVNRMSFLVEKSSPCSHCADSMDSCSVMLGPL